MPAALQPHQLWKLNRQPASGRDDGFFSVADPYEASPSAAERMAAGVPTFEDEETQSDSAETAAEVARRLSDAADD